MSRRHGRKTLRNKSDRNAGCNWGKRTNNAGLQIRGPIIQVKISSTYNKSSRASLTNFSLESPEQEQRRTSGPGGAGRVERRVLNHDVVKRERDKKLFPTLSFAAQSWTHYHKRLCRRAKNHPLPFRTHKQKHVEPRTHLHIQANVCSYFQNENWKCQCLFQACLCLGPLL